MPAVHHNLTVPDHKALRAEATSQVKEELGMIARPDDRFKRACEIVQQADLEIAAHVEDRNDAAMSLWFYDGVRGLDGVLGVTHSAYNQMRRLALRGDRNLPINEGGDLGLKMSAEERAAAAEAAGVPRVERDDAADRLPALAAIVSVATARRKAAMPFLREAALTLTEDPYDWSTERIAELGNTTAKYVRDVKNEAARRRQR
ncbi:hypothetical protein ACQEVS_10120 [Streptomyces sp. CA-181903]|uniref:hypothetical protein n=1 Tax=Streptomyces sp. CA-181903 TaxID=3240055 RepID=UPI003D9428E9